MQSEISQRLANARSAMQRADTATAVREISAARALDPSNPHLAKSLGAALQADGQLDAARDALEEAVRLSPQLAAAQLHLGAVLNALGQSDLATRAYFRAITAAQAKGEWRSAETTPAHLHSAVLDAMDQVERERPRLLRALLDPLYARFGRSELGRVSAALEGFLDRAQVTPADPRQYARFMYVPGLRAQTYYDAKEFAWIAPLQARWQDIAAEAEVQLASRASVEPFLQFDAPEQVHHYLGSSAERAPQWDAFFFFRNGKRFDDNHRLCPITSEALAQVPLVNIADHAPEICFSILAPGTHILKHFGVTNARLVTHLPLLVPPDCALNVGNELHHWSPGQCVVFDDTFEHEAWNRSTLTRVILLMDAWHPDLTECERIALTVLIEGIGAFNR
jgi:aspartate beta-hydroxylase